MLSLTPRLCTRENVLTLQLPANFSNFYYPQRHSTITRNRKESLTKESTGLKRPKEYLLPDHLGSRIPIQEDYIEPPYLAVVRAEVEGVGALCAVSSTFIELEHFVAV